MVTVLDLRFSLKVFLLKVDVTVLLKNPFKYEPWFTFPLCSLHKIKNGRKVRAMKNSPSSVHTFPSDSKELDSAVNRTS